MSSPMPDQTLAGHLDDIARWIADHQKLPDMQSNAAFNLFIDEVMRRSLYLLRTGVALERYGSTQQGLSKHQAIIVGQLVRLMKLYETLMQTVENETKPVETNLTEPIAPHIPLPLENRIHNPHSLLYAALPPISPAKPAPITTIEEPTKVHSAGS